MNRNRGSKTRRLAIGDHVSWNSEAGRVRGRIIKVHTADVACKGYARHASKDDPHKSEHIALHKGRALTKLRN